MAQIDVQSILNAYSQGANIANVKGQQSLEARRIANEEQNTINQQAAIKSADLLRQAQSQADAYKIAQSVQSGGPVPTNGSLTPITQSFGIQNAIPLSDITAGSPSIVTGPTGRNKLSIPLGDQNFNFEVQSPEDYAKQQGNLGLLSQAPALEKQKQLQDEMLQRELAIERLRQENENRRNQVSTNAQIEGHKIQAAWEKYRTDAQYGTTGDFDASPYVNAAAIGRYSSDDLKTLPLPQAQKRAIAKVMADQKYTFLNKKDQDYLNGASQAVGVLPLLDQYNQLYDSMSAPELLNFLSDKQQQLIKLRDQINKGIITSAPLLGLSGRNNNMLMQALGGAFNVTHLPTRSSANHAAAEGFKSMVYRAMADRLAGMSDGQQALIFNDRGLGMGPKATVMMKFKNGQVFPVPITEEYDAMIRGGQRVMETPNVPQSAK